MSHEENPSTVEAWETGQLGASEEHVKVSTQSDDKSVDAALELHPISIRLQKSLIDDLKQIAKIHGIGYQPLMRQILNRFAESEKKRILQEMGNELSDTQSGDESDGGRAAVS